MIPEIGHYALICTLVMSLIMIGLPFFKKSQQLNNLAMVLMVSQTLFVFVSVVSLIISALNDDFSIDYIANHSNTYLPTMYKATMLWGAHEGSILLWLFILTLWGVTLLNRDLKEVRVHALSMLGVLVAGISLFILATSNPFIRLLPNAPIQGADLNPLLQDPGFVIHPPILYAGYVGLSIPFVLAMCAMIKGQWNGVIIHYMRKTTLFAWAMLTLGIALGSWWAYYELGWGGWWFWDPVENASLMPWLSSCALLHALVVCEKRQQFEGTVGFLAILSFGLSLLGTFLVRSGVLTSVHSFASDPSRGAFILVFFALTIGGAFLLYCAKLKTKPLVLGLWSREMMMFSLILWMLIALFTIMLGTLYPILMDALFAEKMSVGAPYFNAILVPMFIGLLVAISFGPFTYWKQDSLKRLTKVLTLIAIASTILSLVGCFVFNLPTYQAIVFGLSITVFFSTFKAFKIKSLLKPMNLAHAGLSVVALAMALTTALDVEQDFAVNAGDMINLKAYQFQIERFDEVDNPHYTGVVAKVNVFKDNQQISTLYPEKRFYKAREMALSEASIKPGLGLDIYASLGDPLQQGWSIRLYLKPFVRWIWIGAIMMAVAAMMASFRLGAQRAALNREQYA